MTDIVKRLTFGYLRLDNANKDALEATQVIASLRAEVERLEARLANANVALGIAQDDRFDQIELKIAAEDRAEAAESANAALVGALESVIANCQATTSNETNVKRLWKVKAIVEAALSNAPAQAKLMAAVVEAGIEMHGNWTAITELEFCAAMDAYLAALRGSDQP